jgi:hypothetical protein
MVRSLAATVCLAIAAVVFTVATAEAAPLVNIYGNLGTVNASTTSNTVGYLSPSQQNEFQSQGFSVGNQVGSSAWDIQEIQVGLGSSSSPSPVVGIYSDFASINGPVPGNLLATFTGTSAVSSKGIYTFTGSFTALENTSYWVVLSNANSASQESYEWYSNDAFSQPTQQNASNVTYLGTKQRDGLSGTWNSTLPSLSIGIKAAVAVPEPPTYALAMVAGVLGAGAAARRRSKPHIKRTINEPPLETSGGGFVVFGPTQSVSAGSAQVENLCYGGRAGCTGERGAARASDPAAHPSGVTPEFNTNLEDTQVDNLCYGVERGAARAPEPGYGSKRSQDGEAQRTCNERMPRWHLRMSGDGARAAPSLGKDS